MSILNNIKLKVGVFLLPKRQKRVVRRSTFHNFESAKSISILFDAREQKDFQLVKKYIETISTGEKKVRALGLTKTDESIGSFIYKKGVDFFAETKLSWSGVPESTAVADFLNKKADILLDLSLSDSYQIKYITALSTAKMKISDSSKDSFCDLTFDISQKQSVSYLIEQINYYLQQIKKA